MSVSAFSGPLVVFGQTTPTGLDYNEDLGTSLFTNGAGILDPRAPFTYYPGEAQAELDYGWLGFDDITTLNVVPYTKAVGAISATANATSATLSLVSSSSITTGAYITPFITRSDTGVIDTGVNGAGLVALDAYAQVTGSITGGVLTVTANSNVPLTPGMVILSTTGSITSGTVTGTVLQSQITGSTTGVGLVGTYNVNNSLLTTTSGTISLALPNPQSCAITSPLQTPSMALWNAMALVGRAVGITAATGATATTATVSSYDIYGYPVVETITLTAGGQAVGKKAHKYIRSVVLNAADATHTYSVDTTDVYGFPLRSDSYGDINVNYAASLTALTAITAATGYTISDRTPASATTGDVRGTYSAFTSATGTNRLVVRQSPQAYNILSATGIYGNSQYANF